VALWDSEASEKLAGREEQRGGLGARRRKLPRLDSSTLRDAEKKLRTCVSHQNFTSST
jgi:hypothetical protein